MACALADSSSTDELGEASEKKVTEWQGREEHPTERMADFGALLQRCCEGPDNERLSLTPQQSKDLNRLHSEFRNHFAHFLPTSWSIEKAGLPRILEAAVEGIAILMGRELVRWKLSGNQRRRLAARMQAARDQLAKLAH
jgi:hypothetical protein